MLAVLALVYPETTLAASAVQIVGLGLLLLSPEVGLLVLIFGVCVWHWLYFLFYESKEGERRKDERREERRKYRGPPWGDPEI
tara:strand:- start:49 stop:297 length:249 start_codon:yes stop_codon:yes gene_type:complete